MIGDGVPITTLERAVSTDVVNAQELMVRLVTELARTNARHYQTTAAAAPTAPLRSHLASGLNIEQSGGVTISVNSGMLCQQIPSDPTAVPTPTALDSSYRVGLNLGTLDATDPWDATSAWWLLEARVVRVVTLSEIRDIYNPATSTFAPSAAAIDKRYEAQIALQWTKGTATTLPVNTAGWAPLGGCYRQAGGGAITDADVINLSVQLEDIAQHTTDEYNPIRLNYRIQTEDSVAGGGIGTACEGFSHDFAAICQGLHVFARTEDGQISDFRNARIMETGSAAALGVADVWGYVYLAPLADRMPSGLYPDIHHRGALIVSRTAPDYHGRNSAAITAPNPLAENVNTGMAVHIGVVRSDGAVNWCYENIGSTGEGQVQEKQFNNDNFPMTSANGFVGPAGPPSPQTYNLSVAGPGGTEDLPYGVQWKCYCNHTALNNACVAEAVEVQVVLPNDSGVYADHPRLLLSCRTLTGYFFEVAPREIADQVTFIVTSQELSAAMAVIGPGQAAGNTYVAGLWGIRF